MLNALLMLGSTNKKMGKINWVCSIIWIAYMLMNSNLKTGLIFTVMNAVVFFIIFGIGQMVKGKYSNAVISICSILIWSILIDTITFFVYPQFTMGQNIIGYIYNGIIFNAKYILSNIVALFVIYGCNFMVNKIRFILRKKKNEVLVS